MASGIAFPTWALLLTTHLLGVSARRFNLPEDPFAFPKYRVTFLNALPLVNDTAEQWLTHGLKGGILEFMDQPWHENPLSSSSTAPKAIDSGVTEGNLNRHPPVCSFICSCYLDTSLHSS